VTHGTNASYTIRKCRCEKCKLARREYRLVYDREHKEAVTASSKRWREKNEGALRAREARYRAQHKEERVAYGAAYKEQNREALRAKERSVHGKALKRKNVATRRARKRKQFVEHVDPRIVYQMHGGCCGICKEFVAEGDFQVDHVIPIARGGLHGYVNAQPSHALCNKRKGAKLAA
jgi:5-methylcytosine-specific restriction endonuclease McrA